MEQFPFDSGILALTCSVLPIVCSLEPTTSPAPVPIRARLPLATLQSQFPVRSAPVRWSSPFPRSHRPSSNSCPHLGRGRSHPAATKRSECRRHGATCRPDPLAIHSSVVSSTFPRPRIQTALGAFPRTESAFRHATIRPARSPRLCPPASRAMSLVPKQPGLSKVAFGEPGFASCSQVPA
jgi:hypothetical protein